MPKFGFNLADATIASGAVYTAGDESIRLVRTRPNGVFDPTAAFNTDVLVTLPALAMPGLTQMFSFDLEADFDLDSEDAELGAIGVQVSTNGGTTWRYWDGAAWTTTTTDYCTAAEVDANCLTIPWPSTGTVSPRVRLKLSSDADLLHTPIIRAVGFGGEIRDLPFEDAFRSVIKYLQDNIVTTLEIEFQKPTTGATVVLPTKWALSSVTHVWNITADSGRATNLYSSAVVGTKTVTLTGSVAQGQVLRVRFRGTCPVKPLAEEEFNDTTQPTLPAFYVLPLHAERDDQFGNWREIETSRGRLAARSRIPTELFLQGVRVYCDSDRNTDAFQMAEALTRTLEETQITYTPTGEPMALVDIKHMNSQDFEARGLYSKQVDFVVEFRRHTSGYREDALVQTITTVVTDFEAATVAETIVTEP